MGDTRIQTQQSCERTLVLCRNDLLAFILYRALRTAKLCWKVLCEQILARLFPPRHGSAVPPSSGSVCEGIKENELSLYRILCRSMSQVIYRLQCMVTNGNDRAFKMRRCKLLDCEIIRNGVMREGQGLTGYICE